MEIISDNVGEDGKRSVTVSYTEEEKAAMKARSEAFKAEMEKRKAEREAARKERLYGES